MSFFTQLNKQRHVIGAVLMRDMCNRFGREGLGFAWLFVEPLMFAVPVLLLWSAVRGKYDHGVAMMGMTVTGYLPILLFRHLGGSMLRFVKDNTDLLFHRHIALLDIFIARCLLEFLANMLSLMITFVIFFCLKEINFPENFPLFILGYFFMTWWCIAISLLIAGLADRSKLIERLWPVYSYTYMFFSGFFFLADWLPPNLRNLALYQPSFQAYEMIRGGMFGGAIKSYGDPLYTSFVLSMMTAAGLWALREGRRYIQVE